MADEQVDEPTARQRLVELKLASEAARVEALQGPYSAERWRHWQEAAAVFGDAVTEHAKQYGLENRFKLEKDVVTKALHPSPPED
ncbi:hypothetical protein [Streptomyces erythrochromogenes]|uniref:hypothetical protein n=1 Tax=Streptomyces erythrochromogenes TaxID=285574 RepID=UPI003691FCB5